MSKPKYGREWLVKFFNDSHPLPPQPRFGTQGLFSVSAVEGALIQQTVLFRQCCENIRRYLTQWAGTWFLPRRVNRLVLRSDKCLNRFGDYVEK
ncbi:hypothetical protein TNCV_3492611 [Trichonephila clavipes]|nr:hypothetical protein TNCV_3492611 [Trichonephila clavipes]